ncbi:hypothetical protein SEEA8691_05989 [Salmonella enterica subsp. enterica serovar Agona str. 392869-1]|nr:hypothetical protein SEEA8691_05989 [Salmonella enterica subsp. enterica serovar Agona str. 392869-1]
MRDRGGGTKTKKGDFFAWVSKSTARLTADLSSD